jgi:PhoH-like ATPase
VIIEVVLEELARFKKEPTEFGANARLTARLLDMARDKGDLIHGVELPGGGQLRIEVNFHDVVLPEGWLPGKSDNRILKVCKGLCEKRRKSEFWSQRTSLCASKAISSAPTFRIFKTEQVANPDSQNRGRADLYTTPKKIDEFFKKGGLNPRYLYSFNRETGERAPAELVLNEFVRMTSVESDKQSALGRFDGTQVVPLQFLDERPLGVKARNVGQRFMQEALMMSSEEIPLVIVKGRRAGEDVSFARPWGCTRLSTEGARIRKIVICART